MKIVAKASGGFSGRAEHYEADTRQLVNGKSIEAMLQDIDFFTAAPAPAVGADLPRWQITVEDGHRQHTVWFAEDGSAEAAPWQSLIAELRTLA
jgi:hypothetical protein